MPNRFQFVKIWDILEKVKNILWVDNIDKINGTIKIYESDQHLRGVIVGSYKLIGTFPCINLEPIDTTINVAATNYSFNIPQSANIGVYVKNLAREVAVKYLCHVTQTVVEILMSPEYNRFVLPGEGTVYNSNVFGTIRYGFMEGGAVRAALIPYTANVWRSGRKFNEA